MIFLQPLYLCGVYILLYKIYTVRGVMKGEMLEKSSDWYFEEWESSGTVLYYLHSEIYKGQKL
ncbi:hypothetical protein C4E22_04080 [ANME-1 cluster archaeon AG-394-G06]|nr:hypothetical protein [ANME-1 cluster archaeon AG-394-G06]